MHHRAQFRMSGLRVEPAHIRGRIGSKHARQGLHGVEHAAHPPERERRRAEPDDFLGFTPRIAPDDLDWIGRRILAVVRRVQALQPRTQCVSGISH